MRLTRICTHDVRISRVPSLRRDDDAELSVRADRYYSRAAITVPTVLLFFVGRSTRLPTLVKRLRAFVGGFTGVAVVADVPAFAGMPAHDFRELRTATYLHDLRVYAGIIYTAYVPFNLRLPTSNQERNSRQIAPEQSTRCPWITGSVARCVKGSCEAVIIEIVVRDR